MQAHFAPIPNWSVKVDFKLPRPRSTIHEIQRAVARHFSVPLHDMKSARRSRIVARPRQVAMYLSRHHTPRSFPEIGYYFGNRDHTTVIHAVKQITRLRSIDADLDERIAWVEAEILSW